MDKQQGPAVQHRELYSVSWDKQQWERTWKRMCVRVTESFCCTGETNRTF